MSAREEGPGLTDITEGTPDFVWISFGQFFEIHETKKSKQQQSKSKTRHKCPHAISSAEVHFLQRNDLQGISFT